MQAAIRFLTAQALFLIVPAPVITSIPMSADSSGRADETSFVHVGFDLSTRSGSPFPSDRFTVADSGQNTGRRVALPTPTDCVANRSDCDDIAVLNELDGFNQHPRVSVPFDGEIDLATAAGDNIFVVEFPERSHEPAVGVSRDGYDPNAEAGPSAGRRISINQIVWDTATHTLHGRTDEALQEHARYVLVVTRGVLDVAGSPVGPSRSFEDYRGELCQPNEPELVWYRRQLIQAERALGRAGIKKEDIAALSVFHTQSSTYLAQRIHDRVFNGPPPAPADFNIGPGGARAVYALSNIASVTLNAQTTTGTALSPMAGSLADLRFVPGAVGRVAFGRYESPDFRVHPGEYVPAIATRTGVPAVQSGDIIYFNVYLPAGPMPPSGWPVAILAHGSSLHKNFAVGTTSPYPAAHGVALVIINAAGHGYGPSSTLELGFTDGTSVTLPAGGRSIDQNGDGRIGVNEGFAASGGYALRDQADGYAQTAADLMQLVRVLQGGIDIDGDGHPDLDGSHITYWGWSLGSHYGMLFFAATPEVTAAVFSTINAPALEHRRLSPVARNQLGAMLAARIPSLLNSDYGLREIDGVPVTPPYFNENLPIRNQPPIVNTVPGAIAIQQVIEHAAWAGRNSEAAAYAPLVRLRPPLGQAPRPVILQFARADQRSQNPGTTELVRTGALEDATALYRHDLFYRTVSASFQSQDIFKHAHAFHAALGLIEWLPIVIGAHEQAAQFLESDGARTIVPQYSQYWEVPAKLPLPDDLAYVR